MCHRSIAVVAFSLFYAALAGYSLAQEPELKTVKRGKFTVYRKVPGTVESASLTPLKIDLEEWNKAVIQLVVREGTRVEPGDLIVDFKREDYEKALDDATIDYQTAVLAVRNAELELEQVDKTHDLDVKQAKRALTHAKEDYEHYLEIEVPERERMLEYRLDSARWRLENAQEEYDQLLQMYTEDELTEESEQIVLKRAKRDVETAEMFLENAKNDYEYAKNYEHPRTDQKKKEELHRLEITHENSIVNLQIKHEQAEIALEKAKFDLEKKRNRIDELERDGEQLALSTPVAGIVYHGQMKNGKWVGPSGAANRSLEVGDSVPAESTVVTIVDPDALQLRLAIEESLVGQLGTGMLGAAIPKFDPAQRAPVKIVSLSRIPGANDKFECIAELDFDNSELQLMPGMTCDVVFRTHSSDDALTVPKDSVFTDDEGLSHYVYVPDENGEPKRVTVTIGANSDDRLEITSGLRAGDQIFAKEPTS